MCSSGSNGDAGKHMVYSTKFDVQCAFPCKRSECRKCTANSCVRRPARMSVLSCHLRHCSTKAHHARNVGFLPTERISRVHPSPPSGNHIRVTEHSLFAIQGACYVVTPLVRKTERINHPHFVRNNPRPTT